MGSAHPPALSMVPELPVDGVRAAIGAEDWDEAARLLDVHHGAIVWALAKVDLKVSARQPWLDLVAAHDALVAELVVARDAASAALAQLTRDRRGAAAWMRELA